MHSIIDRFFPICYGTSNENHTTVLSQSNLTLRAGDKERFLCSLRDPFSLIGRWKLCFVFLLGSEIEP